jgi:hypothetical protein
MKIHISIFVTHHYKCECRVILVKINEDQLGKKPRRVKPGGAGRPGGDVINFIQP